MNRVSGFAVVFAAAALWMTPASVEAGGSWGGSSGGGYSASSGGSSGGGSGFLSRLRARHSGSSGGHVVAHASHGGSSGGSSGGARSGPLRHLLSKIRARRASGSSGGSSGGRVQYARYQGSGSSGGRATTYSAAVQGGSSGGAAASYGSYSVSASSVSLADTAVYESPIVESSYETYAPVDEATIDSGYRSGEVMIEDGYGSGGTMGETILESGYESSVPLGANDSSTTPDDRYEAAKPAVDEDAAMLAVRVPRSATVTVNGHETQSDGELRQFMSRGLKEGFVYTYVVKVTYDNQDATEKSVQLRPGDYEELTFEQKIPTQTVTARKPAVDEAVVTVVQLHVPAAARVSLAGTPTNGSGVLRTFRTKQLMRGEQWTDYTVEVTAEIDGQTVTKERTVNVQAGSVTELTFDFHHSPIASR